MEPNLLLIGLGISLGGVVVVGLADAWLSRSLLIYLDAVESNVGSLVKAFESGATRLEVTSIDLKRDRGQDRARALKTFGWIVLALGFTLQIAAAL